MTGSCSLRSSLKSLLSDVVPGFCWSCKKKKGKRRKRARRTRGGEEESRRRWKGTIAGRCFLAVLGETAGGWWLVAVAAPDAVPASEEERKRRIRKERQTRGGKRKVRGRESWLPPARGGESR